MAYTDELFAELRRTLDRTVEEQVKRQVESMSLQVSQQIPSRSACMVYATNTHASRPPSTALRRSPS